MNTTDELQLSHQAYPGILSTSASRDIWPREFLPFLEGCLKRCDDGDDVPLSLQAEVIVLCLNLEKDTVTGSAKGFTCRMPVISESTVNKSAFNRTLHSECLYVVKILLEALEAMCAWGTMVTQADGIMSMRENIFSGSRFEFYSGNTFVAGDLSIKTRNDLFEFVFSSKMMQTLCFFVAKHHPDKVSITFD